MSKKIALNFFLLIIACALASLIYFSEEESYDFDQLSSIDTNTVNSFSISHNGRFTAFKKTKDNHWEITQPTIIEANDFRIKSLLKIINAPIHSQYSKDEINVDTVGLRNPQSTINFDSHSISFGIINPTTKLRYILYKDRIYTIEDVYFPLINSHFSSLVSLNLITTGSKIKKLILLNQTIKKDDKGLWQSNINMTADQVAETLENWKSAQAFGVHQYLERDILGEVFIYTDTHTNPISYIITDVEPWLIIARPEIKLEYHLEIESYKQLIRPN